MNTKYYVVGLAFFLALLPNQANSSLRLLRPSLISEMSIVSPLSKEETQFLNLLNEFRTKLGLNPLVSNPRLRAAAFKHGLWMLTKDGLTHLTALSHMGPAGSATFEDRIVAEAYYPYTRIGENLACGRGDAAATLKQFALSPGHLKNMLSPRYREIGISRLGQGTEACPYYWVNTFGSNAEPASDRPEVTDPVIITAKLNEVLSGDLSPGNSQAASPEFEISCTVNGDLGKGLFVNSSSIATLLKVTQSAAGFQLEVSYQQEGNAAILPTYTIGNIEVVKSPFYPLISVVSIPTAKFGGFSVQIDLPTGRAQFDPYPGLGGVSGPIECRFKE